MESKLVYHTVIPSEVDPGVHYFIEVYLKPGSLIPYAEDLDGSYTYKVWGQTANQVSLPHQTGFGYVELFAAVINAKRHVELWEKYLESHST